MPKFLIELKDGRKFHVEADQQPTEAEVMAHLETQGGATKETPQAAVQRLAQEREQAEGPGALSRFAGGLGENLNPVTAAKGMISAVVHPWDTAKAIGKDHLRQFGKAIEDFGQGHYSEAAGHGVAAMIPILGPAAARAGETIGQGDVAGGLGQGIGLIGSMLAPEAAAKAYTTTGKALSRGAERIVQSNIKPDMRLVAKNPGVNIARTVLDENFKPGAKGAAQAVKRVEGLSDQVTALNAADAAKGNTYSLQPLEAELLAKRNHYMQSPSWKGNVGTIDAAVDELYHHPLYSREVIVKPATATSPAVTRRELIPQDASTLNTMKKRIYEDNPQAYGPGYQGAVKEADMAQGRALKGIMDRNVEGVQDINNYQGKVIVARKALTKMGEREANKYPIGLMDLGAGIGAATGGALLGPWGVLPGITVAALKHPSTAFPIAHGLDALGKMSRTAAPTVRTGMGAAVVGEEAEKARKLEALRAALGY